MKRTFRHTRHQITILHVFTSDLLGRDNFMTYNLLLTTLELNKKF